MKKTYQNIEEEKKSNDDVYFEHPSFGMIGFSRVSGGDGTLFGSSIKHNDKIMMQIKHAKQHRTLHHDYYHGKGTIIEIEMSYSQFAECITSLNTGSGVPCTLRFTEQAGNIPMIANPEMKRDQIVKEFQDTIAKAMEQTQAQIKAIQDTLDTGKTFGVKTRKEIIKNLEMVQNNIGTNLDFCMKQFNEQMDKTIVEAKGEIETFCQNKLNAIAQATLVEYKDDIKKLDNPIDLQNDSI